MWIPGTMKHVQVHGVYVNLNEKTILHPTMIMLSSNFKYISLFFNRNEQYISISKQ